MDNSYKTEQPFLCEIALILFDKAVLLRNFNTCCSMNIVLVAWSSTQQLFSAEDLGNADDCDKRDIERGTDIN